MISDVADILGNRQAVLARELTKVHEEFLRGTLGELARHLESAPLKGEMTLVVAPANDDESGTTPKGVTLRARVEQLIRHDGLDRKAALKQAAREFGIPRREAYKQLLADGDMPNEE